MKSRYQLTFVFAILASVGLVLTALLILVLALGWRVLFVLGAAFIFFVVVLLVRDALRSRNPQITRPL